MDDELSRLVDALPGLIWTARQDAQVDFVNQRWCEYTGISPAEARGEGWGAAMHADDLSLMRERWPQIVDGTAPAELELRMRRFDGEYRWFLVRVRPLLDSSGRVTGWCGVNTDIHDRVEDRRQAEAVMRASERDLKVIINTIPALAWSAQPDGLADFFNQHFLDYVGFTQEQAKGTGWAAAVHPDDLPGLLTTWGAILASEKLGEAEARLRRFDGQYRWFLFRANPLRDASGQIVQWYGVNTDIDDRRCAAEELKRSEASLTEGQRLSLTGSFSWFLDTNEWALSSQARCIFGFEQEKKVRLECIASRVHPEDLPLFSAKADLAQEGITDHDYEFRLRMPDGRVKHVRTNAYHTTLRVGRRELIGAIQDVTEWRLSEEALGKVRSELAHVTRVASLGALTASIAHEVNQPLSGIITNAHACLRMLGAESPNLEGVRETARRTIRDGNRASEVITRLRALFSKKQLAAELVDLNEATREVLALLTSELQRARVVARASLADHLPPVSGDRVQLQQVILNLLLNASAAMSTVDERPRQLTIQTELEAGERVRLTVRDTGVGLDPLTVDRLFEPFFTTKTTGMGVGLSVSRSIVESHRGRLWAEPNAGPGATFCFSLPCAPAPAADVGSSASRTFAARPRQSARNS
jgi:PAS domain S-box-containing protein